MRFGRSVLFGLSAAAVVVVAAACVGDDPEPSAVTTPNDGGGTPPGDTNAPPPDTGSPVDAGADAPPQRHCESVTKPTAPTEFFCADFDGTGDAGEGWTSVFRGDGGTMESTAAVAVSVPNAISMSPPPFLDNGTGPLMQWKSAGAKNALQSSLRVKINPGLMVSFPPDYTGDITLIELGVTSTHVALLYTRGGGGPNTDGGPYYGYYVQTTTSNGIGALSRFALATPLEIKQWTDVKLTFEPISGHVVLTYNGVKQLDITSYTETDTSFTASLGANGSGDIKVPAEVFRYDDVEITLAREQ